MSATDRIVLAPAGSSLSTVTASVYANKKNGKFTFGSVPNGLYVARALSSTDTCSRRARRSA